MATEPGNSKSYPSNLGEGLNLAKANHPELSNIVSPGEKLPKIDLLQDSSQDKLKEHNGENTASCVDSKEDDTFPDHTHHHIHHQHPLHQHLPTAQNLSVPLAGNRIRRRSAPSMLEPIQEGLLGVSNRRNSGTGSSLVPLDKKDRFQNLLEIHNPPLGQGNSSSLSKRRRSDPIGLLQPDDKLKMFSFEARYPAPRRNSLVSATLDELTSQFELLDRRKRVVEESELMESEMSVLPPILITDS